MSDATQVLRLLGELERLERADDPEAAEDPPTSGETPIAALLATLVENDFDLGRAIVDSANDA